MTDKAEDKRYNLIVKDYLDTITEIDPFRSYPIKGRGIHIVAACKTGMSIGLVVTDGKKYIRSLIGILGKCCGENC